MALSAPLRARLDAARPALGGAPLGNLYRALDDGAARSVVDAAWGAGCRVYDTAPHYGQGRSEHRIGDALRARSRDDYVLSTKVGRLLTADPQAPRSQAGYVDTLPFVQRYDYTADGVWRSVDASLRRLGVTRIDIAFVHDIDVATHGDAFEARFRDLLDGGLPALAALKAGGVIGGYGLGVNGVDICLRTLAHADLDVILLAGRYTLLDGTALPELLPRCARRDVAVMLGGPFNSGVLASGTQAPQGAVAMYDYAPASAAVLERVAALERVCAAFAVPLKAAALQFPRGHPAVCCVVAGARTPGEAIENAALARHPIPDALWQALANERLIPDHAPWPLACDARPGADAVTPSGDARE